ncbi:CAP domain-containing protein [Streptomyces sp. SID2999]|uniref:CAP domain-containing protein n=1 Tax=Streptomyces sp. SID2999 TaxID=2690258 RepID=UPI001368202F|nr:CAP domain-containing protein [Streptomyces sp. SID2999]MYZ07481.1 CAP domain-containing protein [Streptomyces sp. SID2999]
MGRHRRSGTAITEPESYEPRGTASYQRPQAYAATAARSTDYLYATDDERRALEADFAATAGTKQRGHRRAKKAATPVRTGLLGVSAAVALGTAAVATGAVPGLQNYRLGGTSSGPGETVQAVGGPGNAASEQGGASGSADTPSTPGSPSTGGRQSTTPASPAPSAPASAPTSQAPAPAKPAPSKPAADPKPDPKPTESQPKAPAPEPKAPETSAPVTGSAQAVAEAEVLRLVNVERAKVGCTPVAANSALTGLAEAFSGDMAARDFFDHTDPDGATPWDRAAKAGITGLGGENIARGQSDAAAVMEAWMNSPGHRANILNCDFKTLGVGVHMAAGGPWWTQDFGY